MRRLGALCVVLGLNQCSAVYIDRSQQIADALNRVGKQKDLTSPRLDEINQPLSDAIVEFSHAHPILSSLPLFSDEAPPPAQQADPRPPRLVDTPNTTHPRPTRAPDEDETTHAVDDKETTRATDDDETTRQVKKSRNQTTRAADGNDATRATDENDATRATDDNNGRRPVDENDATRAVDDNETTRATDENKTTRAVDGKETTRATDDNETSRQVDDRNRTTTATDENDTTRATDENDKKRATDDKSRTRPVDENDPDPITTRPPDVTTRGNATPFSFGFGAVMDRWNNSSMSDHLAKSQVGNIIRQVPSVVNRIRNKSDDDSSNEFSDSSDYQKSEIHEPYPKNKPHLDNKPKNYNKEKLTNSPNPKPSNAKLPHVENRYNKMTKSFTKFIQGSLNYQNKKYLPSGRAFCPAFAPKVIKIETWNDKVELSISNFPMLCQMHFEDGIHVKHTKGDDQQVTIYGRASLMLYKRNLELTGHVVDHRRTRVWVKVSFRDTYVNVDLKTEYDMNDEKACLKSLVVTSVSTNDSCNVDRVKVGSEVICDNPKRCRRYKKDICSQYIGTEQLKNSWSADPTHRLPECDDWSKIDRK